MIIKVVYARICATWVSDIDLPGEEPKRERSCSDVSSPRADRGSRVHGCRATGGGCATGTPAGSGPADSVDGAPEDLGRGRRELLGQHRRAGRRQHVTVESIITNPDADPHDYEPTPADARAMARAQFVIANGVGYDPWVAKLLDANPVPARSVLTVGDLVGVKDGDNPHRWYAPDDVHRVIEQIAADYQRIDPADAGYFDQQKQAYETHGLARYNQLIADIKARTVEPRSALRNRS